MSDQHKALARRFLDEVCNEGRDETIDELIGDDYVDHGALTGQPPGPDGARAMYTVFRNAFPDLRVDVHEMVAERDLVAVRATFSGTSQGALMGAQPTGNPIALTSMLFLRLRDGKIVERWEQADLLGLMLQLNIVQQGDSGGEAG